MTILSPAPKPYTAIRTLRGIRHRHDGLMWADEKYSYTLYEDGVLEVSESGSGCHHDFDDILEMYL